MFTRLRKKIISSVIVVIVLLLFLFFFKHESHCHLHKLADFKIINDIKSFRKDSLNEENLNSSFNSIIRYNFNCLIQKEPLDSLLFNKMNALAIDETNNSKKKIIELLNILKLKRDDKLNSSKSLLDVVKYFEHNNDYSAQIQIYSSLYFLNTTQKGIEKGNDKLANYYSQKIISIKGKSENNFDNLLINAHFIFTKIRNSNKNDEQLILYKFKESEAIIKNNPSYNFFRSEIFLTVSYWYFSVGQFDKAQEFNNKVMEFSNSNMEKSTALYYNAVIDFFKNNYQGSLNKLQLSVSFYNNSKEKNITVELFHSDLLFNIYQKTNKEKDYLVDVLIKKDSLKSLLDKQEDMKTIQELQSKYNFEKSAKEIEEQTKSLRVLVVTLLVFFILIVVLLYYFNENKKINIKIKQELKLKEDIERVISHDILSPILALEGLLQMKIHAVKENKEIFNKENFLNKELNYVVNTKLLCQNLIEWLWTKSKTKSTFTLNELNLYLEEIKSSIEHYLELNNCQMKINIFQDSSIFSCTIDKNALAVVVRNIVYNIIKHSKAKNIHVTIAQNQNQFEIVFLDNGIPIEQEDIAEINEYLKDSKSFKKYNGLGLYLVKSFINKHNYKIVVSTILGDYSNKLELIISNK